jgi:nudix motif 8
MKINMNMKRMMRCQKLQDCIPVLRQLFDAKKNESGIFPLFPPHIQRKVWRSVAIRPERQAAVLVPLVSFEGKISLLFTLRSNSMPSHASEISFPGGHFNYEVDQSLEDTALRETREELLGDYPFEDAVIIGQATSLPSIRGTPVSPIIGVLPYEISRDTFPGDSSEVEEIFCVPLTELKEIETSESSERFRMPIPVFPTKDHKIWGLTAVVTRPLLHKLFLPSINIKR